MICQNFPGGAKENYEAYLMTGQQAKNWTLGASDTEHVVRYKYQNSVDHILAKRFIQMLLKQPMVLVN
jgi:hypothetical protein